MTVPLPDGDTVPPWGPPKVSLRCSLDVNLFRPHDLSFPSSPWSPVPTHTVPRLPTRRPGSHTALLPAAPQRAPE